MVELGDKVRDTITGLEGVVVCVTRWLNGCLRVGVQPTTLDDKGNVRDIVHIDMPQVEKIEPVAKAASTATGGPQDDPGRLPGVSR